MKRLELKAALTVSDAGEITGIAWPFGTPDRVGDMIVKGAFNHADRLPMLFAHDQAQAVGVWDSIAETSAGLEVKGRLLVEQVNRAREVRALVQEGAVTGLSIGFETKAATGRPGGGRTIKSLVLHEISIVSIPAHPGAQIQTIKELELDPIDDAPTVEDRIATLESNFTTLTASLDKVEKAATRIETKLARPGAGQPIETKAEAGEIERKAFGTYLRLGNQTPADELKALTVASDPQAGYLAPAETSTEFIRDLIEFSPIRSVASVRNTGAPSVKYPRRTGITNAQWEGELDESDESTVAFGQLEVNTRKLTTFVDISNELLGDSAGAAEQEVRLALAEDFGQKEAVAFVKGTGVNEPEGLMTHADIASANAPAAALAADHLIDLLYSLPAAYRNAPGARWALNGTTLAHIRKLRDGDGRLLWQPAFVAGEPETILGKPVLEMVDLDDIGANKFPIIFGDFSAYRILDRLALSILSDPYTQARRGVTRIHATRRVGGRVLQPARFRKIKTVTA